MAASANSASMHSLRIRVREAADMLKWIWGEDIRPQAGFILGSGLGSLGDEVEAARPVPFSRIPHFPAATVAGHAGNLIHGLLEGKQVIMMQGRIHFYEGYGMPDVVFPIYVMKSLGVQTLVITNAAGGLNRSFAPGDIMLIADHLNMTGLNPLAGLNDPFFGPRFPDMSEAYDPALRSLAKKAADALAREQGCAIRLQEGVYSGITGPNYMTGAELKMLARLGGDAVGMSTVAEVIAAVHAGMRVLGISCITDMAIGEELEPLTHEQVMAVAGEAKADFVRLLKMFLREVDAA